MKNINNMNNEIGRKLTSLTLMTIMLAGGMTIAAPSMMVPEVAAAGALYVSAENAMFENHFGGAQIVEVVVIGHATATDVKAGEPMVKVDEHQLRMAQGIDGNWYGYFGDSTAVPAADETDNNLDFGLDSRSQTNSWISVSNLTFTLMLHKVSSKMHLNYPTGMLPRKQMNLEYPECLFYPLSSVLVKLT